MAQDPNQRVKMLEEKCQNVSWRPSFERKFSISYANRWIFLFLMEVSYLDNTQIVFRQL